MEKNKKKTIVILSVVIGVLLILLIAGYILINTVFSIVSRSFTQVTLEELEKEQVTATATPFPEEGDEPAETSPQPNETDSGDVAYSSEKSQEMMDAVSFGDKVSVMTILSKNLSSEEYSKLLGMLSGGITSAEIEQAKDILRNSLSPEDKQTVKEYYNKYSDLLE